MEVENKKGSKIATRMIFLCGSVLAVLIFSMIAAVVTVAKNNLKNIHEDECAFVVDTYTELLSSQIMEYYNLLNGYCFTDVVATEDPQQIVTWLRSHTDIRSTDFEYVAFVDLDGNFEADNGSKTTVKDRSYYKDIVEKGMDTTMDDPVESKITGKKIVHICKAAKHNGKLVGFFTGILNVETISNSIKEAKVGTTGVANLFAGNDTLIATSGSLEAANANFDVGINESELPMRIGQSFATGKRDALWSKNAKNQNSLITFRPVPNSSWLMLFSFDETDIRLALRPVKRIAYIGGILCVVVLILMIGFIILKALEPLKIVQSTINGIAEGNADLTKRIELKGMKNDEVGKVVMGFNKFAGKLQEIVKNLKVSKEELLVTGQDFTASTEDTNRSLEDIISNIQSMDQEISNQSNSVTQTAGAVNQIASNIESLNHMIENQASSVVQASTAVEEMIGNINSVDSSVNKMANAFEQLEKKAVEGVQKQEDVNSLIKTVETESQTLQEANSVISSIAEQTNLLAMNAAIEAAHAGEAGKGFSVVADEIRKLSETSSQQSKTIGEQLKKISDTISNIVKASSEAGTSFSEVSSEINGTTALVNEIKNAMMEQSEGSKQISQALNNMNDSTAEVRTASLEMSEGNKAILVEIRSLQDSTLSMKDGMEQMSKGASMISETGSTLDTLSKQMENSIKKIGNQIDEFKV